MIAPSTRAPPRTASFTSLAIFLFAPLEFAFAGIGALVGVTVDDVLALDDDRSEVVDVDELRAGDPFSAGVEANDVVELDRDALNVEVPTTPFG